MLYLLQPVDIRQGILLVHLPVYDIYSNSQKKRKERN